MGTVLFLLITGAANFIAGFALAIFAGVGPANLSEVLTLLLGRTRDAPFPQDERV